METKAIGRQRASDSRCGRREDAAQQPSSATRIAAQPPAPKPPAPPPEATPENPDVGAVGAVGAGVRNPREASGVEREPAAIVVAAGALEGKRSAPEMGAKLVAAATGTAGTMLWVAGVVGVAAAGVVVAVVAARTVEAAVVIAGADIAAAVVVAVGTAVVVGTIVVAGATGAFVGAGAGVSVPGNETDGATRAPVVGGATEATGAVTVGSA
jgi:hypothetical protein